MEAMALAGGPAAGEFIHKGQRQPQVAGQPLAIAAAVLGLLGGLLAGIQR